MLQTFPGIVQNQQMRGLGMPDYDRPEVFGDLFVEVLVQVPGKLSPGEKVLFEHLAALKQPGAVA